MSVVGTNTGHGHVWERPDGLKARCGGPRMCSKCALDFARMQPVDGGAMPADEDNLLSKGALGFEVIEAIRELQRQVRDLRAFLVL